MPETSIDEAHSAVPRKDQVRLARQVLRVQAIAEPKSMKAPPESHFRFCVFAADARHDTGSLYFIKYVCHDTCLITFCQARYVIGDMVVAQ